jgi:hypothetical protein
VSEENGQFNFNINTEGASTVNVEALDRMIAFLGNVRAQQLPPVRTTDPDPQGVYEAVPDPRWWIRAEPMAPGVSLHLRHPGLGWQVYLLPLASLQTLQETVNRVTPVVEEVANQQAKQTKPN